MTGPRKTARDNGDMFYDGDPCATCGCSQRYTKSGNCVICHGGDGSRMAATRAREYARGKGLTTWRRYKPCGTCGTHERYVSNSACVECSKRKSATQYKARILPPRLPSPRNLALAEGSVKYTAKRPCRRCGTTERYTAGGACVQCMADRSASQRELLRQRFNNPQGDRVLWVEKDAAPRFAPLYAAAGLEGWHCVFSAQNGRHIGVDVLARPGALMTLINPTQYEAGAVARIGRVALMQAMKLYNMAGNRNV